MCIMSISFPGGGGVVSISYPGSKPGNGVDGGVEVEVSMTISISPTQDVLSRLTEVSCWDWIPVENGIKYKKGLSNPKLII